MSDNECHITITWCVNGNQPLREAFVTWGTTYTGHINLMKYSHFLDKKSANLSKS